MESQNACHCSWKFWFFAVYVTGMVSKGFKSIFCFTGSTWIWLCLFRNDENRAQLSRPWFVQLIWPPGFEIRAHWQLGWNNWCGILRHIYFRLRPYCLLWTGTSHVFHSKQIQNHAQDWARVFEPSAFWKAYLVHRSLSGMPVNTRAETTDEGLWYPSFRLRLRFLI
jgi:hypothetical protein